GRAEDLPVHEGLPAAGPLQLLGEPLAAGGAEEGVRRLQLRAARTARESLVPDDAPRLQLDDGLERRPELPVVDDLDEPFVLVPLPDEPAQVGRGPALLHHALDLAVVALERAVDDEPVAHVDQAPLAQVRHRQPRDAGADVLLDPVGELLQVLDRESVLAVAPPAEEEHEAVAIGITDEDVTVAHRV